METQLTYIEWPPAYQQSERHILLPAGGPRRAGTGTRRGKGLDLGDITRELTKDK